MFPLLQKLGLTPKEAALYIAALQIGEASPVSTIAKKAQINRTTAYDILEILVQKGLIISTQQKKYRYYAVLPPEKLVEYLKGESRKFAHMAQEATAILPELQTVYRPPTGRPRIYFYEGDEGLTRVYEETLQSKGEILAYASDQINQETMPWYFPQYYKRRAAKGIPIRGIFPDAPKNRERHALDKEELRRSLVIPKSKIDFTPEINFFDNKMMIADWEDKLGIIIESEKIVKVFKQTFELAWEAAEKYHKALLREKKKKKT